MTVPMPEHMSEASSSPDESLETRRKRLLWRATHRGIKEMDLLVGNFARQHVSTMARDELDEFERIIGLHDQDMLRWATGLEPVPPEHNSPMLAAILGLRP